MSDIVERLREMPSSLNDALRTMDVAADEIERLRSRIALLEGSPPTRQQILDAGGVIMGEFVGVKPAPTIG